MILPCLGSWRRRIHLPASLRSRAILLLFVALVPTAIVALLASTAAYVQQAERERAELRLEGEQLEARLDAVWTAAERLARLIGEGSGWQPDFEAACTARLNLLLEFDDRYSTISVYRGGREICRAQRNAPADNPLYRVDAPFLDIGVGIAWRGFIRDGSVNTVVAAQNVAVPGHGPTIVAVAVDPTFIIRTLRQYSRSPDGIAMLLTHDSGIISGAADLQMPVAWRTTLQPDPRYASLPGPDGVMLELVTRKLSGFDAWLMIAVPRGVLLAPAHAQIAAAVVTLMLMISVTAASVWFGLSYLILRWIRDIAERTKAYARGDLTARAGASLGAPEDIAILARNFDEICDRMAARSADLEREVKKQETYLRDLHHHVKNTLQIASSLIGLQMRSAPVNARIVLRFPFDRINAIAAAYAAYYGRNEPNHVAIGSLVTEVVDRLCQGSPTVPVPPRFTFLNSDEELDLITARTLAMLLAELLPRAIDESSRTGQPLAIYVRALNDQWQIEIYGLLDWDCNRDPLSRRLLNAHIRHIAGSVTHNSHDRTTIAFPRAQIPKILF